MIPIIAHEMIAIIMFITNCLSLVCASNYNLVFAMHTYIYVHNVDVFLSAKWTFMVAFKQLLCMENMQWNTYTGF